jgi:hypothetical protein
MITSQEKTNNSGKVQHRWSKELSEINFYVDYKGAKAVIQWVKRNELLLKKGAVLREEIPLNKDGTIGFSARFAMQIREEQREKVKDFVTIEDITLKSVNEVGHFLYFAGTNSWLVLKDDKGKTIDEYATV